MSNHRDYYEILGVSKNSSPDDIKKAYRKLAVKYHPDKNPDCSDAADRFKEIASAYDVLSDPKRKEEYDRFGPTGPPQNPGPGGPGFGFDFFGGDIFEHFFGRGNAHARAQQHARSRSVGSNIVINLAIGFMESVSGVVKNIQIEKYDSCSLCKGEGGSDKAPCGSCKGSGYHTLQAGSMVFRSTCSECQGSGLSNRSKCKKCDASGRVKVVKNMDITIPPGVDSNNQLRLQGQGNYGPGGYGDVYVNINVQEHPKFKRDGKDIVTTETLTPSVAALGKTMKVQTVRGFKMVNVPPGVQHGSVLKMEGQGMPDVSGGRPGDHKVKMQIKIPKALTDEQKELYQQLIKIEDDIENEK